MMRSSHENSSQPGSILYSLIINCISKNCPLYFSSFKRLAKETHPDRPNGDKEQFQKLQMAFMRALKTIEVCKKKEKVVKRKENFKLKGGAPGELMHGLLCSRDGPLER